MWIDQPNPDWFHESGVPRARSSASVGMEGKVFAISCAPSLITSCCLFSNNGVTALKINQSTNSAAVVSCSGKEEVLLEGMPPEYYDDEWQARQREKTKELRRRQREEEEEEQRMTDIYREIGTRLKAYPEEYVKKARKLVSSFIKAAEEVEERIEEAAEKGELDELVLMVIWNRLDLARRDDEKDAIRSLDLLYRRVETEILKRQASPAMRLLNELLNMHDALDEQGWLKECRKCMVETFPREDPYSILLPRGFDLEMHQGPVRPPAAQDDALLRVDFVREVAALLEEVRPKQFEEQGSLERLDPESIANKLKQQERQRSIYQVEALLELAINLKW